MKTLSHILSALFSPLLLPTYGMALCIWLTIMTILPPAMQWSTLGTTFFITAIIPMAVIFILYKAGYVTDPGLNERTERGIPYAVAVVCYLVCAWLFFRAQAPLWVPLFLTGGAAAIVINVVVNRWWKISAHAAGMGGLVGLLFFLTVRHLAVFNSFWWFIGAILLSGMVMSARIYLGRHTLGQTLAGFANGFLCVTLATIFV